MDPLDVASKNNYLLLDFAYGVDYGTHYRLTNYTSDVTDGANTYTSQPKLSVLLPENGGGMDAESCTVKLPRFDAFTTRISDGLPHSRMMLTVQQRFVETERTADPLDPKQLYVFTGAFLNKSIRNIEEQGTVISLEFKNVKALLQVPLGIVIGPKCSFPFESEPCGVVIDPFFIQEVEILAMNGNTVNVGDPDLNPGPIPGFAPWHKGYLEYEGLRLGIRKQTPGLNTLHLYKRPPAHWLGAIVTAHPGCDKQLLTCQNWGNELNNGTFGNKTPNYYPNLRNI